MNYDHEKLLSDFANRTRQNLQLIREIRETQPEREAYEVTQLVNSMLGLLVFPKEHYLDEIPNKTLDELKNEGWPIPEVRHGLTEAKDLKDFLRLMRNAIAHFNVEFAQNEKGEITGLKAWNEKKIDKRKVKNWQVELTLEQMENIALRFIDLITEKDKA